jgi:MoaA/NifB/PqqE/SkfB family radical SAM enzyme
MRLLPINSYLPTVRGLISNALKREAVNPFYASFKLTSRCHFGCPFCNVKKQPVKDLTTDEVKAIMRNLSNSSVLMASFEGGEPLLRSDIEELLIFARKCKFYLLFTTSVKNLLEYPLERYAKYIDFLHVSIDEGHDNLTLFDSLSQLSNLPLHVSVQTVVTKETIDTLEWKVKKCYENRSNIVVIPAAHMDSTENYFPDMQKMELLLKELRRKYPNTIHTPQGYFKAYRNHKCSPASVIIAPDGYLYYPCHILDTKGPDLRTVDLKKWLTSDEAKMRRQKMRNCQRNCGWYQYYSIDSYTSIESVWDALRPILAKKKFDR